jgi:acyl transferase domain-containing protein
MVSLAIDDRAQGSASASCSLTVATPITPVAVIGRASRLPARIDSPERLRQTLLRSGDLVTEIRRDRLRTALIAGSRPELTEAWREVADGDTPYQAA